MSKNTPQQAFTKIKCPVCKGTATHPRNSYAACGACSGTGCSTNPYDQCANATMVGRELNESLPGHFTAHSKPSPQQLRDGMRIVGILVSWPNPEYASRLALDQAGLLY
jgi:hypothetical protein